MRSISVYIPENIQKLRLSDVSFGLENFKISNVDNFFFSRFRNWIKTFLKRPEYELYGNHNQKHRHDRFSISPFLSTVRESLSKIALILSKRNRVVNKLS